MSSLTSGGSLIGRYRLVRQLGRGGAGEVWLADDQTHDRRIVVKVATDLFDLLEREYHLTRKLAHPNIVRVHDLHRDTPPFLTMEYLDGGDLGWLRGRTPHEVVKGTEPIARALHHAHHRGVIHRDVKIRNVLCDASGVPRLTDFGIAASVGAPLELAGGGSRHSISPQQLAGAEATPADDIYALGALLYELLSGAPPLGASPSDERIARETPAPVRSAHPLPARLRDLVSDMLAKEPTARPETMAAVAEALSGVLGELTFPAQAPRAVSPVQLTPPPRIEPLPTAGAAPGPRPIAPLRVERGSRTTATGVAILLPLAAAVFFLLPRWVEERDAEPPAEATATAEATAPPAAAPAVAAPATAAPVAPRLSKRDAEEALGDVMQRQADLSARAVEVWGGAPWEVALAGVRAGDQHLADAAYGEAVAAYRDASEKLDRLAGQLPTVLAEALARGDRALAAGDDGAALEAYDLVLAIEPRHPAATRGRERAAVLDEVRAALAAGAAAEQRGDFASARASYQRALALDPATESARAALQRIDRRIRENRFAAAMSDGLRALDDDDFATAIDAFGRAAKLRPDSAEARDGLGRAERGQLLRAVDRHRRAAATLEASESWRQAEAQYAAILALDPTIAFAQEGAARSAAHAAMQEQLQSFIDNPDRLSTDAVLTTAEDLLDRARASADGARPRHQLQLQALERLVANARKTIAVVIESDDETEVTVYRVGRLGTFKQRSLELRPGTYTVVGSRRGYRDVRRHLVVVADRPPAPLLIRCEEEI